MDIVKIAIVCDGKEISYGINLSHLFHFKSEQLNFSSDSKSGYRVDLYSQAVFRHASISKKAIKIYVGCILMPDSNYVTVYNEYGMTIKKNEKQYIINASEAVLTGKVYDDFIAYANRRREEYLNIEKSYVDKVCQQDESWISSVFEKKTAGGLFQHKNELKIKRHQQFDCLSCFLYLDFFGKEGE